MKTYYMFGDSLMRGVMPDAAWNYHSSDAIGFDELQKKHNIKFQNFAMPTFTSDRVKQWMIQTMARQPLPDVAFIECGGNDCDYNWKLIGEGKCDFAHRHRGEPEAFRVNYSDMIRFLKEKGVEVVAVIAPPIPVAVYLSHLLDSGITKEIMGEYVRSEAQMKEEFAGYAAIMTDVANENHCHILDLRKRFIALPDLKEYYSPDGMHPNEKGYGLIHQDFDEYFSENVD